MDDVCNYVFQGKGKVNEDMCETKYDCADKVICDKSFCATQKSVTTTCGNPGDTCRTGNYCAPNSSQVFVCMAKGDAGDMCDAATPCKETLRCAGGTCADRVAAGATCISQRRLRDLGAVTATRTRATKCDPGLSFAAGSPSCADYGGSGSGPGTGGRAAAAVVRAAAVARWTGRRQRWRGRPGRRRWGERQRWWRRDRRQRR